MIVVNKMIRSIPGMFQTPLCFIDPHFLIHSSFNKEDKERHGTLPMVKSGIMI